MRSLRPRALRLPVATVAAIGVLFGWSATGVGASVAGSVTASTTKIQPCVGHAETKPKSYVIACADANTEIRTMTWKSWTSKIATGTGFYEYNTCNPTCVAGHDVSDATTVTLSNPKTGSSGPMFSQMSVKYWTSKSKTKTANYTLPLKAY